MKALLVLKDLQLNRPDKATYLTNHKKTGLWPWTQLSASPHTVLFRWKSFLDHVDHAARRAPRWWTTTRPRKGTVRSREDAAVDANAEKSTRVHWFGCHRRRAWLAVGVVGGDEASTVAQAATGGRSRQSRRRWFGRLVQEEQRLKKQQDCSIQIQRLLLLESFVD